MGEKKHILHYRVDDAEKHDIQHVASLLGYTVSDYLRRVVMLDVRERLRSEHKEEGHTGEPTGDSPR